MKKISILSIAVLVVLGSFFSCNPKDDQAPKIYFSSDVETSQSWVLQEYYTLPSATASDNQDGDMTSSIKISNDLVFYELRSDSIAGQTVYKCENKIKNGTKGFVGRAGEYVIVYSATDEAGNKGSKSLNINVLNSLDEWSLNSNGDKIGYIVKRTKINDGSQDKVGGLYADNLQYDTYDFTGIDGKVITNTFSCDKSINYRLKISKLGNIGGLALKVDFNRFTRVVDFDDQEIIAKEQTSSTDDTMVEFLYVINRKSSDVNEYNPDNKSFTISYQVERWIEDVNGIKEFDGKHWSSNKKCSYTETYVPE